MKEVQTSKVSKFVIDSEGVLRLGKHVCIPDVADLKKKILKEAHNSSYIIHPSSMKMYQDIKEFYWWDRMKKEIAEFVSKCLVCQ